MKHFNMRMKYGTNTMADGDVDGGSSNGGGSSNWRDTLSDDNKSNKSLADFKDINGLAKAYLDTKADNGRSLRIPGPDASEDDYAAFNTSLTEKVPGLTRIPGEDASEDARAAFYTSLGRPKEASGYVQPDTDVDTLKTALTALASTAHAAGLSKSQYDAVAKSLVDDYTKGTADVETMYKDEHDKFKLDWGANTNAKSQAILELAKQTGAPDSVADAIANRQMDSDTMKWLDSLVDTLSGPGSQMDFQGGGGESQRLSPDEAQRQVAEIMDNPAYWDASNPQQPALIKKALELQQLALS